MIWSNRLRTMGLLVTAGCLAAAGAFTAPLSSAHAGVVRAVPLAKRLSSARWAAPPTTADCLAQQGISCYDPSQLQTAYNLKPLYAKGLTGKGHTIVIVDSFGSPTAKADLQKFDKDFGLPDPPRFDIIQPAGKVPAFDPTDPDMAGWGEETSLDLQWSHSIAPGANILLVETPVSETEGVTGFPEIVKAENYVVNHHLGDVISQSFGATEQTFPSKKSLLDLRSAFVNAAAHGITVLGSSGDAGPTDFQLNAEDLFTKRVNSWPSSDPLVTSVGGTQLHLDATGKRIAPDNVWNDTALLGGPAASGGGRSSVFSRPSYQHSVASTVGSRRGTPDISMSAAVDGGVLVRIGFTGGDGITPGYYIFGGTSEASPEFAGVVAIAAQRAHHPLGLINPKLYGLGTASAGIVDVTRGDNTVSFEQDGQTFTVKGFRAVRGYDLSTGLGTVDAAALTKELAGR
jgi:subtilase family serine protease